MTGISNGKLCMDLNKKCTDCHQYLDYTSSHPEHTKMSIAHTQILLVHAFMRTILTNIRETYNLGFFQEIN